MAKADLTAQRLREALHYDPETGVFTWATAVSSKTVPGARAGNQHIAGYFRIRLDGYSYKAHRLAWLYMTGAWPAECIDHINRNNSDNRFSNLREATHKQNMENTTRRKGSRSGIRGVYWHTQNGNWRAQIRHAGKTIHIGVYPTKEEAAIARLRVERQLFTHSEACAPQA